MCPSLIQVGSKTAEKNSAQTNKQTNRQTDRHYENNGPLAVNQKSRAKRDPTHFKDVTGSQNHGHLVSAPILDVHAQNRDRCKQLQPNRTETEHEPMTDRRELV